jgi:hypothetical protein
MPKTLDRILEEEDGKSWSDYKRASDALERHDAHTNEMWWGERAWTYFERRAERRELDQELNYFYGRTQMAHELTTVIREAIERTWAPDNTREPTRALTLDQVLVRHHDIDRTDRQNERPVLDRVWDSVERKREDAITHDLPSRKRDDFDLER